MEEKIEQFKNLINESNNIVFFGGAGVSTESGIPDFRSKDGLYNLKYKYPPEEILSHTFFINHTEEFYEFYKDKMNCLKFNPNVTHIKLAELEKEGKLKAVITQNIDGLHQKAGSKNVYELHGSVLRNYCMECGKFYNAEFIFGSDGIPKCSCGGIIKPDVVLYEEGLDQSTLSGAIQAIQNADLMIVAGTSLTVYPASGLINYFRGKYLVLINRDATAYDYKADLVINDGLGKVFGEIRNSCQNIEPKDYIGKTVKVKIDRPLNSKHPKHGFIYPVNYGFVPNTISGDGEELDCYVLGVDKPIETFEGRCIAVIHRLNDDDDKLIIVPDGDEFTDDEITRLTNFQEQYFESEIVR